MKVRYIKHIGTRVTLRVYCGDENDKCPNCNGSGKVGYHNSHKHLFDTDILFDSISGGKVEDYSDDEWPATCDHCGKPFNEDSHRQVFRDRLYDNESGTPEIGDMYYRDIHEPNTRCWNGWDNCDGKHLYVVLPNGHEWDIDGKANNCTMPDDRTHRCWVRHGEPPNITVDKNGCTCQAGAGSILSGDYHGFLINGELTKC